MLIQWKTSWKQLHNTKHSVEYDTFSSSFEYHISIVFRVAIVVVVVVIVVVVVVVVAMKTVICRWEECVDSLTMTSRTTSRSLMAGNRPPSRTSPRRTATPPVRRAPTATTWKWRSASHRALSKRHHVSQLTIFSDKEYEYIKVRLIFSQGTMHYIVFR